jgi:hypothetical protein
MTNEFFFILVLVIIGFFINMIVGTYKGRDPFYIVIVDRIIDFTRYLFQELRGDIIQKINGFFATALFLCFLGFLASFFYCLIVKGIFDLNSLMFLFIFIILLAISMPVCTVFTRARYK